MDAEDEVQRVEHRVLREDVRERRVEEVLLHAEALDPPPRAPDVGRVGHPVRRLLLELHHLGTIGLHRLRDRARERGVVHERQRAAHHPARGLDALDDRLPLADQVVGVATVPGRDEQLHREADPRAGPVLRPGRRRNGALVGRVPDRLRDAQALRGEGVVVAAQRPRGGGETGGGAELPARVLLGEHPAVVGRSKDAGADRRRLGRGRLRVEHHVVGLRREVAEVGVLAQGRADDPAVEAAEGPVAAHHGQGPVLDLLQDVGLPVRLVHLDDAELLVDGGVVVGGTERLPGQREAVHRVRLRLDAQVVVTGVVPAAPVEAGHRLTGREPRQRRGALQVPVEVVVADRGHAGVVEVAGVVPDPVALIDAHVAHLDRKERVDGRLPDVALVDVLADPERVRARVAVADDVHPRGLDRREVEAEVVVAEEAAPGLGGRRHHLLEGARLRDSREDDRQPSSVARVRLHDRPLLLLRVVADLRDLDRGRGDEARDRVGRHPPLHGALRRALRDERAHHEPAVVVLATAVHELETAAPHVLDRHPLALRLGGDDEPLSRGERCDLVLPLRVERPRPVRLAREDAGLRLGREGLPEEDPGKQLQVEADPTDPLVGQRLLEVHEDAEAPSFRTHAHGVGEAQVGVLHRVEALAVLGFVGELRAQADLPRRLVHDALADLRHRLPLPRRPVEANVAVRRDPQAVLDDPDPALVPLGVVVVREHDVEPRHLQVLELVQLEGGRRRGGSDSLRGQGRPRGGREGAQRQGDSQSARTRVADHERSTS